MSPTQRTLPFALALLVGCAGSGPTYVPPAADGAADRLHSGDAPSSPELGQPPGDGQPPADTTAPVDGPPLADGPGPADSAPADTLPPPPAFVDVPANHPHLAAIEWVAQRGIMRGCQQSPPSFCPDDPLTRAAAAVTIVRMKHGAAFGYSQTPYFSDVPAAHWAFAEIQRFFEDKLTTGCGDGKFCPDEDATRAQGAVFLMRAKHGASFTYVQTPHFIDVDATHWAFAAIQRLYDDGITKGCGAGTYCPEDPLIRAHWATFLMRVQSL